MPVVSEIITIIVILEGGGWTSWKLFWETRQPLPSLLAEGDTGSGGRKAATGVGLRGGRWDTLRAKGGGGHSGKRARRGHWILQGTNFRGWRNEERYSSIQSFMGIMHKHFMGIPKPVLIWGLCEVHTGRGGKAECQGRHGGSRAFLTVEGDAGQSARLSPTVGVSRPHWGKEHCPSEQMVSKSILAAGLEKF